LNSQVLVSGADQDSASQGIMVMSGARAISRSYMAHIMPLDAPEVVT